MTAALPRRLLIANRGEIAVRIAHTCRAAGVETVVVYTALDAGSPHVLVGNAAVEIPSYLDTDALLAAAHARGCDAIHPGYGFLSENADFADAVGGAGLVFVGPPSEAMRVMGSKASARERMQAAGVPVVPGSAPGDTSALAAAADKLGYPVFLKAIAGGGGKGMSIVHDADELAQEFRQARDEALRSFGDGGMYVEKLVDRPRHVEVQVFADSHGNTVSLGERECSIQRRHQKIVEESPSPAVDAALRQSMGEAACEAARAVGYVGAGTIEFLLSQDGSFYFLEMNTRLQVEHPVTEWVTGLDLVRLQLEVAFGAPLPPAALHPEARGHAIECRVYAEDPRRGFLPQSGTLLLVETPTGPGVRVDAALASGQEIGVHFDPMLAKVSTWGRDRDEAIGRMREALRGFVILGVVTNIDHLQDILATTAFRAGDLSTAFLQEHLPDWSPPDVPALALAATAMAREVESSAADTTVAAVRDPWNELADFRVAGQ